MDIKEFSLFPTLVIRFRNYLNLKECNKFFKYLKTKKIDKHNLLLKGKSNYNTGLADHILHEIEIDVLPALKEYSDRSKIKIENKIINSWFNIQDKDSVLKTHNHPRSTLSGALFINAGKNASQLCFHNPNPFINNNFPVHSLSEYTHEWYSFYPEKGDLIIFPSWLYHGSNYMKNNYSNRTVISFNAI